jgi:hypothetical protein
MTSLGVRERWPLVVLRPGVQTTVLTATSGIAISPIATDEAISLSAMISVKLPTF